MIKHSYRTFEDSGHSYMACSICGASVIESDNPCLTKEEALERWQVEFAKGFGY